MAAGVLLALGGCGAKHYEVRDLSTGQTYHSTKVRTKQGAVTLHDPRTGARVMLQNAEVQQISAKEYREALKDMKAVETGTSR